MKKGLIITTTLAMVLGVGVAVGAHQAKATKVEAVDKTVYCKMTYSWWTVDGAAIGVHYWGGTSAGTSWPGVRGTAVSTDAGVWKFTVPSDITGLIFTRVNGSGTVENWGAKTGDLKLPTDGKNLYTITSSSAVWGDPGVTGEWSAYTEPTTESKYKYSLNGAAAVEMTKGSGTEYESASLAFKKGDVVSFTKDDAAYAVTPKEDGQRTKVYEVTGGLKFAEDYTGKLYLETASASLWAGQFTPGYYLAGVKGEWNPKLGAPATLEQGENPAYAVEGVELNDGDAIKMVNFPTEGNNITWYNVTYENEQPRVATSSEVEFTVDNDLNLKVTKGGTYNIYYNTTSGWYSIEDPSYVPDVPAEPGYYLQSSVIGWKYATAKKMTQVVGDNVAEILDVSLAENEEIRVRSYFEDRTPYNQWADSGDEKKSYGEPIEGGNFKITKAGSYDIYAKYENGFKFFVAEHVEPEPDPVFTVVNRTFDPVTFVLDEDDKPEGVKHQYSAQLQYAQRGGELKFYADGVQITEHIGVDAGDEEHVNNVYGNVTDGFRIRHTCNYSGYTKVYLKTYEDGGYSVWGDGYAVDFFSVTVKTDTATAYNLVKDETFEPNETYIEQFKTTKAVPMKAMSGEDWDTSNGIMCDGLAPDVAPEAVSGNNAMAAFQATAWKVHNDCEEVIYLKIRKTDLSVMMYIGGYEEAHVLTIGGKTVNLSDNGDGQYVAHGVALSAGDEVTSYTIEGVAQTVTSKAIGNNNLTEGKKVVANVESADIYYDVEAKTLWISGLPSAGQHLLKNGNTAIEMTHTDPYEGYDQYASGLLTFAANDTIKVLDTSSASSYAVTWCPTIVATSEKLQGKFVYDETNKVMKCIEACSAAVYLKIKAGVDEVYFGDVPEYVQDAVDYVNHFKGVMHTACGVSQNKKNEVEAGWSSLASEFRALSEQAQGEVKLGGYSLVDEIKEFGERYIAIKQQHPDWNLENFLEWDIPSSGRYVGVDLELSANNNMMVIIIAIAATSAIALTALLVIKKRKHH